MKMDSHRVILDYQESWKTKFKKEKTNLEQKLKDLFLRIDHIGSTSVSRLSSKPIIDISILIDKYENREKLIPALLELGYIPKSPGNERDFYEKGTPVEYHISVCFLDRGGFFPRQIIFRDYLIKNDDARIEYDNLKRKGLENDPTGYDTYISDKTEFVYKILNKAGWIEKESTVEFLNRYKNL
jgi:GrpB-like predicted nucleotidyltransferase (UPF0157 family)